MNTEELTGALKVALDAIESVEANPKGIYSELPPNPDILIARCPWCGGVKWELVTTEGDVRYHIAHAEDCKRNHAIKIIKEALGLEK